MLVIAGITAHVADFIKWLAENVGGYGWAMVLLGIITKLLLLPLYHKQLEQMKAMQKVQPYLQELQKKYKDNQEELARRTVELFRQHNVNPFGGCLLTLLQFPILIVIYRAIYLDKSAFEGVKFLWIKDLAQPDLLLFLIYMLSMYLSFELTPTYTTPEERARTRTMNTFMLIMFAFILYKFPSAFILYWLSFNLVSTLHTFLFFGLNLAVESGTGNAKPEFRVTNNSSELRPQGGLKKVQVKDGSSTESSQEI